MGWVGFLNDATKKANFDNVSFDEKTVSKELKLTAIPMLKDFIGKFKGRHLTNLLSNLEKSFQLVSTELKKDPSLDDFRKLSFLALSNTVTEILKEMRIDAYSKGKNFDPIEFLNNYESELNSEFDKKKKRKAFNGLKKNKEDNKKSKDEDSDYVPTYLKKKEKNQSKKKDEESEDIEESS